MPSAYAMSFGGETRRGSLARTKRSRVQVVGPVLDREDVALAV
jgi:hypothetical protein